MSLIGHLRGPRPVREPDLAMIRDLDVDVVIPAHNERTTIALCLASVLRQTIKPHSVTVIDDGSDDGTAEVAEAFAAANDFAVRVIRRQRPIGKTVGLKRESRALEGEVEFILDGDTILMSEDFIEKVVAQLFRVPGIASASGVIYPLRDTDRAAMVQLDTVQRLLQQRPDIDLIPSRPLINRIFQDISNFHRDAIFQFIQIFFYQGLQNLFGSIPNPVGCAVAYRRDYLREMFDRYEPEMGDNLTTSEDIFLGTAMMAAGYHNIQNIAAIARTDVPELQRLPRQLVRWSSAWLQTGYHLPDMLVSPFKAYRRYRHKRRNAEVAQKRVVVDGYRQPFGLRFVKLLGRPSGWILFVAIFEKISFFLVILLLLAIGLALGAWLPLIVTIALESLVYTALLVVFSKGRRLEYAVKGISALPFRYGMMATDAIVFARFVVDLAIGRRSWRK